MFQISRVMGNYILKHVDVKHGLIVKNFEKQVNNLKSPLKKQLPKKGLQCMQMQFPIFLGS